jgi:DNA-binding NarL/FixJ family response regulator
MRLLTERQKEVLTGYAEGLSASEVGERLDLSARTVEKYSLVIRRKMDAKNTMHAIYKGAKAGWI